MKKYSILLPTVKTILRFIDHLLFAAICAAALWIPFRRDDRVYAACLFVLLAVVFFLVYADNRKSKKKEEQTFREVRETIRIEKLLLTDDSTIRSALREPDLFFIRKKDAGESEILEAIRTGSRCILIVGDTERFRPLLEQHAQKTRLIDARECLDTVGIGCSGEEVNTRIAALAEKRPIHMRPRGFSGNGRFRFYALGALLLVLSFVWRYKIYYRMLSAVCFAIPVITGAVGFRQSHLNFGNHLDNMDK